MQVFNFPLDLDVNTFMIIFMFFLIVACAISWVSGYSYEPEGLDGREDRISDVQRANLWAKVTGCIGFVCVVLILLSWENCFNRLDLSSNRYAQIWFGNPDAKVITISKIEIDSIHYGLRKGSLDCYVRIQLKSGKSYKSTFGNQCRDAYASLNKFVNSK